MWFYLGLHNLYLIFLVSGFNFVYKSFTAVNFLSLMEVYKWVRFHHVMACSNCMVGGYGSKSVGELGIGIG